MAVDWGMSSPSLVQRVRQTQRLLRIEGYSGVSLRIRKRAARRLSPAANIQIPVEHADLIKAAELVSSGLALPLPVSLSHDEPLAVAWICAPQEGGGGGFTNVVRLAASLEANGNRCIIYLYDRHGWSLDQHVRNMRGWWPELKAEIRDVSEGISDSHAIFATSWETAYKALSSSARGTRFYLVQDFEPSFYAAGSEALLAEATYSFGFHGVTLGRWLSDVLAERYGMATDYFDFGCDLKQYSMLGHPRRTDVCVYARPSAPRRAFALAVAAMELFAERHPEIEIHMYGETVRRLPFRATDHGLVSPNELNTLYNRCIAGLVLSATNLSLAPHEMLAAGCIPVINDAPHNRAVLDNPEVVYAPATPFDLANALSRVVERPAVELATAAERAATSVRKLSWADAGKAVEETIRRVIAMAAVVPIARESLADSYRMRQ